MAMRNTSLSDSKYGELLGSVKDAASKAVKRAPQIIRNARIEASGAKGGMGSKGRAKAGASNPATQNFKIGK
jgi:hypothetical protein